MNIHKMCLNSEPFRLISDGTKTVELRLNDEKRKMIKPGDRIEFTDTSDGAATILTEVIALHRFASFDELYKSLPLIKCGYTEQNVNAADPSDMDAYYSREKQKQYGVLGIELQIIKE